MSWYLDRVALRRTFVGQFVTRTVTSTFLTIAVTWVM